MMHFLIRKRSFSQVTNILVHFFLGVGFMIIGIYVTSQTWAGLKNLGKDMYGIEQFGAHNIIAENGQTISVDLSNVASCPAFDSCKAQEDWFRIAHIRGIFAFTGSIVFDTVL
jgi:hypothetical protein